MTVGRLISALLAMFTLVAPFAASAEARPPSAAFVVHDRDGRPVDIHILDGCVQDGARRHCPDTVRVERAVGNGPRQRTSVTLDMARVALGGHDKDDRRLVSIGPVTPPGAVQNALELRVHRPNISAGRLERVWFVPDGDGWRAILAGLIEGHEAGSTHSWTAPGGRVVACEASVQTVSRCELTPDARGVARDGWPPLRETCVETVTGGCIDGLAHDAFRPSHLRDTNHSTIRTEVALRLAMGPTGYRPDDNVALDEKGTAARYLPGPCGATRTVGDGAPETLKVKWRGTTKLWSQLPSDTGASVTRTRTIAWQRADGRIIARRSSVDEPPADGPTDWRGAEPMVWVDGRLQVEGYATHVYDADGLRVETVYRADPDAEGDPGVPHRMGDEQPISWGRAVHAYDEAGRPLESRWIIDEEALPHQVSTYRHDPRGRLVEQMTVRTEQAHDHTVKFTYDAAGHLVRRDVDADVRSTEIRRYDRGNLVERSWWEGEVGARPDRAPDVRIVYDYGCWSR